MVNKINFKYWVISSTITLVYFLLIILLTLLKFSNLRLTQGFLLAILLSLLGGLILFFGIKGFVVSALRHMP